MAKRKRRKRSGGPAYPCCTKETVEQTDGSQVQQSVDNPGVSALALIAGFAMHGMVSNPHILGKLPEESDRILDTIVERSTALAVKMVGKLQDLEDEDNANG